ncbi:hypothetical protein [Sulfurovum sp.]|uniref:hypothetical protein n=1 Tax=Sulfurovum sp. TaxID=1969726 RepID=UPI002867D5A0|nr:hypothetical protein [Sulfurovum sp.]
MKRFMMLLASGVAVLAMSGCGGGDSSGGYVPVDDGFTTLFLVDEKGLSYGGVPYICDSMSAWSETASNGEFSFYVGEECTFDFIGLEGNYDYDPVVDHIVYIVDDLDGGKGDIPYECVSFGVSTTYTDGSFYYDTDDKCVFGL